MLNGANSKMVSHVTGNSIREETSRATRTVDIVRIIRTRRMRWLGHILRMDPQRLVHKAVQYMSANRSEGDLLMDVPATLSWEELKLLAANRDGWRLRVNAIKEGPRFHVTMNHSAPTAYATRRKLPARQDSALPRKQNH